MQLPECATESIPEEWVMRASTALASKALLLPASEEMICKNLKYEKVGNPFICRLERVLQRADPANLYKIDLSRNSLTALPPSLSRMTELRVLILKNNMFTSIPKEVASLNQLRVLDISTNPMQFNLYTKGSGSFMENLPLQFHTPNSIENGQENGHKWDISKVVVG